VRFRPREPLRGASSAFIDDAANKTPTDRFCTITYLTVRKGTRKIWQFPVVGVCTLNCWPFLRALAAEGRDRALAPTGKYDMAPILRGFGFRNLLLAALNNKDLALVGPHLKAVSLASRQELERPNVPIESVFFPETGIVSVVNAGMRKKQLEIGIIGREGMTGLTVVLGNDRSPHSTYIQVAGNGYSMGSDVLRRVMRDRPSIRDVMLHYVQAFMIQTAFTAISNGSAKLEERLARWLLMAHDRIEGDELPLIHDFLALMLGVRRPGVTVALNDLEVQGLISAKRRSIVVIDRVGLEDVAGASYGTPEAEYARLMRSKTPPREPSLLKDVA
jgi:CRP-like cAMP-binding protein